MIDTQAFAVFRNAPADDLAMLGFIHALHALADALLDDESKRMRVWQTLQMLTDEALRSGLADEQLDYYLRAVYSVDVGTVEQRAGC